MFYQTKHCNILQTFLFFGISIFVHFVSLKKKTVPPAAVAQVKKQAKNTNQVHLVRPLEVVFHCPIVQTNPGVIVTQAWTNKTTQVAPFTVS